MKNTLQNSKVQRLLWVEGTRELFNRLESRWAESLSHEFLDEPDAIRRRVTSGEIDLIISPLNFEIAKSLRLLEFCRLNSPKVVRVGFANDKSQLDFSRVINSDMPFGVLSSEESSAFCYDTISAGLIHRQRALQDEEVMKGASSKNRELDDLHRNLEDLVLERTRNIELRKNEIEKKQKRIRDLIRFVNELSHMDTVYDFMTCLRKELRRSTKSDPPLLICQTAHKSMRALHFRGTQLIETPVRQGPTQQDSVRILNRDDQAYLANELGRPIMGVLAFRLPMSMKWNVLPSTLFIEVPFGAPSLALQQAVEERLQPIGIALERILLGEQVRAASLQWEKTFDAIATPVCIVDLDFEVERANMHFSRKGAGSKCYQIFAKRDTMCSGCPVADVLAGGKAQTGLIRTVDRTYEVHSYPIRWREDLRTTKVVNHYVDATEEKELYGRMIQGEKMAALGLLAANIAHELNNPLTGLRSLSQVLQKTVTHDPRLVEDLHEVESAAGRCQKIIRNLLDFTHSKSAPDQVFDLNEAVNNTIPMLKTALRYHNSGVTLADRPIWIKGDPHLVQQVIFNLVNNACQAMKEPGSVWIETTSEGATGFLKVTDTGPGVSADVIDQIFDPFFTTKPVGEGTGLGLSVSRQIIQKYGGDLNVANVQGGGCCFTVTLPLTGEADGKSK